MWLENVHYVHRFQTDVLLDSMKENAVEVSIIEFTAEHWRDNIETPIATVKMGENQTEKMRVKGRTGEYGMMVDTLSNPDIIVEEADKIIDNSHERASSYIFAKTFIKEDGTKYINYESVTISKDGNEVSISSHIIRENQLRKMVKNGRLIYKATAIDESANTSAEQSAFGGSLSSHGKVTNKSSNGQVNGKKSASSLSARTVSAMDGHVRGVAERLGLSNVDVVADGSGLDGRRGRAKGFFDKKTGRITIVLGKHSSVADVERTLLHEAVAHYGLRRLFGDRFDAFLDGVFENVDRSTREKIVALAGRHGWDFRTATEEYLASIAEDMNFERYDAGIFFS